VNDNNSLIFIPTYNECENVEKIIHEILDLNLINADILFIDDNSPDGTGEILDNLSTKYNNVRVIHRRRKLGIGSAHLDAIKWAYENRYDTLITMDCDFTHSPSYIPKMMAASASHDIVVTSRYIERDSLEEWNIFRKALTVTGHILTKYALKLRYDATGAFRLYKLHNIPQHLFSMIQSGGYSFFFESLFYLNYNGCTIKEIPIKLPARTYGHSKMRISDILNSVKSIFVLSLKTIFHKASLSITQSK
jgi:dolichol-phosphate mannosyltransferase